MSRSLERLTAEVEAARSLGSQLAVGTSIVELDPSVVDPSPVPDRLPAASPEMEEAFIAAIRERGQESPILVRPHPKLPGRYQVAFGHRRLRAATALGRSVRAFIKNLTDEELVVAQGQENNARADLSFIERASFARVLEDRGHSREIIMAALMVDKTELSRLISVRRCVPDYIVSAIGPAPKAGRGRWVALAKHLERQDAQLRAQQLVAEAAFSNASSDDRFVRLFAVLQERQSPMMAVTGAWTATDGTHIARVDRTKVSVQLTFNERLAPDFGDFVLSKLDSLYDAYKLERAG
jgi:ParB family chromosome partitioning protein